nr:reverse transcriptase domain-containing protein [Tanacetum cinerariifolium]
MADNRTMDELLQAPMEGDVPNDVIKLMMFPYSLEGAARVWYNKVPPNSILTWEDLVNKFMNQFFPPSKTTHLKNEISLFTQRFKETFGEAWEQFKEILRACPHHEFTKLAQIDIFYNGLNDNDQDSLNAAAGGNLLSKTTREALQIIKNKSKVRYSRNKPNVSRMNTNSRENASKMDDRIDKQSTECLCGDEYLQLTALATYFFLRRCLKANKRVEVYYEGMEPFKSLMCLWVRNKSIAAIWLEKVVTPLIKPGIKGFAASPAVLKPELLKVDKTRYE